VDWRTEIRGNEPVRTRADHRFRPCLEQGARTDGALAAGVGACTATDVVIILEKKRQKLESLEVICSGERAAEPPTVWTKLELLYRFRGQLDDAAVKHAIQLSEDKYCSVAAMLRKTATLSWRYEILPPAS